MASGYQEDLAYIHDAGFGAFASNAGPFVLDTLHRRALHHGRIVDLGCGSGILAAALSGAGYEVLGIDQSPALLALARQRAPQAQFQQASLWAVDIPPCQAITAIGECFNYLFDTASGEQPLQSLFRRIYAALSPGAFLIFDVAEPGRVPPPGILKNHTEGQDWAVLVSAEEDSGRRLLTRRITSFRRVGDLYRRDYEVHHLRLFPRSEVVRYLENAGFDVEGLAGYGELRFAHRHAGFLASKP